MSECVKNLTFTADEGTFSPKVIFRVVVSHLTATARIFRVVTNTIKTKNLSHGNMLKRIIFVK